MANYFDSPATGYEQYRAKFDGGFVETGVYSFTTTGTYVDVPTYFSKIIAVILTPTETLTTNETLFCPRTISAGVCRVSRIANTKYREYHFPLDNGQIAAYNYANVPLMIAQAALTLTQFEFYHGTAFGSGTTICNLGISTDDGKYLEDISVTNAADTTSAAVSTTDFSSGTATVADGAVLIFETEGGGTSGPGDGVVSMSATETAGTYTSGLTFNYQFIGLY